MPDIFLVRHGEAAASWGEAPDPGLSELGKAQAEAAARTLIPSLDGDIGIVSSPLARAQETAQPLCNALAGTLQVADEFREIPSPVALPQRQAWLREFMRGGWAQQDQPLHDWRTAALSALENCSNTTVIFTHFLLINAVAGAVLQRDETLCFWPDNASITHLRLGADGLELVALGREMETVVN